MEQGRGGETATAANRRSGAGGRRLRSHAGPGARFLASVVAGSVDSVRTTDPVVALTFDDGPDDRATADVLAVLEGHDVRATFFVVAARAEAHSALVRRALDGGHEVALHGAEHVRLGGASLRHSIDMVWHGQRRLQRVTGEKAKWFRPPFGSQNLRAYAVARAAGMQVVSWSADAWDWRPNSVDACIDRAMDRLAPGAVLLLHDGLQPDAPFRPAELVERLLPAIAAQGLRALRLGELLHDRPAVRAAWFRP